jgi:hypothetical protein
MFHPPANAPHAAVAYRITVLDARWQDRAGGPGRFFKYIYSTIVNFSRIIILKFSINIIRSIYYQSVVY